MNLLLFPLCAVCTLLAAVNVSSQPVGAEEAIVEIIKQKLVKFPEDNDQQPKEQHTNQTKSHDDEAKRILEQIEKVNQALGYVKKQPDSPRVPPMLDSSQYLFPKPAYHPFHEQNHQFAGAHGETLLVPSIRSYRGSTGYNAKLFNYNVPPNSLLNSQRYPANDHVTEHSAIQYGNFAYNVPPKTIINNVNQAEELPTPDLQLGIRDFFNVPPPLTTQKQKEQLTQQQILENIEIADSIHEQLGSKRVSQFSDKPSQTKEQSSPLPIHYFFRPNQVQVPAPQTPAERKQLPTHFVMPVRLYKLNKSEYVEKFNPQEYNIKGYKIVGDIDNFYGKAKQKFSGKTKSTPKYHLFFLPREMLLNERTNSKTQGIFQATSALPDLLNRATTENTVDPSASREEKLANRPFRIQTTATTSTTNKNGSVSNTTSTTQVVRKRIVPKPLRPKDQTVSSVATQPQPDGAGNALSATSIKITAAPLPMQTQTQNVPTPQQPVPQSAVASPSTINTAQNINTNANADTNPNATPSPNGNTNKMTNNFGFWPLSNLRPFSNSNGIVQQNTADTQTNDTNVIKNAFQNIFRLPFRPDRPIVGQFSDGGANSVAAPNLQSVPLQVPQKTFFSNGVAMRPQVPQVQVLQPQLILPAPQPIYQSSDTPDDYKWEDEQNGSDSNSAGEDDSSSGAVVDNGNEAEKNIFGHLQHHRDQHQATQQEAIKQGGIIIQRLKVRKGGIAIAGPGGVATAGSGGTAIVGPGGYALTHPRSLTIAGPGAKVIAIPASVDLGDALKRTNLKEQTFPREGRIVATGPTIYYAPSTGEATAPAATVV